MEQLTYRRLIAILRRQWWVILQAVIIISAVAGLYTHQLPAKPYETSASFLVVADSPDNGAATTGGSGFFSSQLLLLKSDSLTARAAAKVPGTTGSQIQEMLDVSADSDSGTVIVRTKGRDPVQIVQVANAVVDTYIDERESTRQSSLKERQETVDDQLATTSHELDRLGSLISDATLALQDTTVLDARREVVVGQYQTLFEQQQMILTQLASEPQLSRRLSAAVTATRPPNPSAPSRAAVGAILGLVVGCGLGAFRELTDTKIRGVEDAAETTGLPILAELPRARSMRRDPGLYVLKHPHRGYTESLLSLFTTIRFMEIGNPVRSLTVTSPESGDGKSMVAANLAAEWALAGLKTILVSGDLRRPTLDEQFGSVHEKGLSDLLSIDVDTFRSDIQEGAGDEPDDDERHHPDRDVDDREIHMTATMLDALLRPTDVPLLWLLPSGTNRGHAAELLGSSRLPEVIEELRQRSDMIIIDSPPTLVADALILGKVADATIVIVSANRSRNKPTLNSVNRLANAGVRAIGVALNRVGSERSSYQVYTPSPQQGTDP